MVTTDEIILTLFLIGLTIGIYYFSRILFQRYGLKRAFLAGILTSLMYFGLLLMVTGTYLIFTGQPLGYSIFAIGFAVTGFGLNGFLNIEQSRNINEILILSRKETPKFLDAPSFESQILISVIMIIWSVAIIVVLLIWQKNDVICLGLVVILLALINLFLNYRKLPVKVDENLCRRVLNQFSKP